MRNHRLGRLALLTQGVALVGLGMTQLACGKDASPPVEPVHVNSPPLPEADASTAPTPITSVVAPPEAPRTTNSPPTLATDAGVGPGIGRPTMNAPPKKLPTAPSAKP